MKLKYMGKYSGNENDLPQKEHPENAVPFKEPQNMKKFALVINVASIIIFFALLAVIFLRTGRSFVIDGSLSLKKFGVFYLGILASVLAAVPHEFLHALCFKDEVQMYQNLKQGMLFVIGIEDMSKARFIFMSLLPNIIFGFIPFLIFLVNPSLIFFGSLGALGIASGAGDYLNVVNAAVQVPKGAKIYMSGMHSYWYLP